MLLSFINGLTSISLLLTPTLSPIPTGPELEPVPFLKDFNYDEKATSPIIRLHDAKGNFFCSGVVVDKFHALTAAHCVDSLLGITTDPITIISKYGTFITYAYAEAANGYMDSAIIRGDFANVYSQPADFKGTYPVPVGARVKACGYPAGQWDIYCVDATISGNYNFQLTAKGPPLLKGQSGGPVFYGNMVIGVNSSVSESGINFGPIIGLQTYVREK